MQPCGLDELVSNLANCLPIRGAELTDPTLWAGLSMFDTSHHAARRAMRFRSRLGRFIARLEVPVDGDRGLLFRMTLMRRHFTVMACAATCLSFVREVQPIPGLTDVDQ